MELKGRLRLIADKVPACRITADIGTDHAYIPIHLVRNRICEAAVAADVRKGPLRSADENIRLYGLQERIITRMGNGLEPIRADELDAVVIAGMGGQLIAEILEAGREKAEKAGTLVLQPMNAPEVLRYWLYMNGFSILDEELVQESGKLYNVICAHWTGEVRQVPEIYLHIGEKLFEKCDPLLTSLMDKKLVQWGKVYKEIREGQAEESDALRQVNRLMGTLRDVRNQYIAERKM